EKGVELQPDGPNATRSVPSLVPASLKKSLTRERQGTTTCRSRRLAGEKHAGENLERDVPRGPLRERAQSSPKARRTMEVVYQRCGGLDVHKKLVVACLILLDGTGQRTKEVRTFRTTTQELLGLRDWLSAAGCTHVAMEATGVYW